jgi:predicted RNase H-like HicB family nuclease
MMATIELDAALLARYPFEAGLEDEEGSAWAIFFPDAPGCMTRAETWEEIGPAAREALHWWLQSSDESFMYLPAPTYYDAREPTANGREDRVRPDAPRLDPDRQTLFTVRDIAHYYGITPGRVRQIAGEQNIGKLIGNVRVFRRKDFDAFACRDKPGRPRKRAKGGDATLQTKKSR